MKKGGPGRGVGCMGREEGGRYVRGWGVYMSALESGGGGGRIYSVKGKEGVQVSKAHGTSHPLRTRKLTAYEPRKLTAYELVVANPNADSLPTGAGSSNPSTFLVGVHELRARTERTNPRLSTTPCTCPSTLLYPQLQPLNPTPNPHTPHSPLPQITRARAPNDFGDPLNPKPQTQTPNPKPQTLTLTSNP